MEIERMFLNTFSIEKKPVDICELIEAAIRVAAVKHPAEFEKRKKRIFNMIMYPGVQDIDDDDDDEDDDISTLDDDDDDNSVGDEDDDDSVGDEDDVTSVEEPQKKEPDDVKKIRIVIKKTVQVAPLKKHNNCNAITETTETEMKPRLETNHLVRQQFDDADTDKKGTPQSHNTTNMASRKRMSLMNESTKSVQVAPPRVRLLSDFSFEKQLDGDKQRQKQSHKGFKKMENDHDTEKKKEEGAQQTPTQRRRKDCTSGLMKTNVATKPVQVAPHQKELLSDCSPQKQCNYSSITRPMQKETQSISDMKKKFESSKRKFEGRLAEQREAKRRTVMVDFHDMPKPDNDSCAPRRRYWNWKRF